MARMVMIMMMVMMMVMMMSMIILRMPMLIRMMSMMPSMIPILMMILILKLMMSLIILLLTGRGTVRPGAHRRRRPSAPEGRLEEAGLHEELHHEDNTQTKEPTW